MAFRLSSIFSFIDECSYWSALDFCRLLQTGIGTWLICLRKEFCAGEKVPSVNALSGGRSSRSKFPVLSDTRCPLWTKTKSWSIHFRVRHWSVGKLSQVLFLPGAVSPPHPKKEEEEEEKRYTRERDRKRSEKWKETGRKSSKKARCKRLPCIDWRRKWLEKPGEVCEKRQNTWQERNRKRSRKKTRCGGARDVKRSEECSLQCCRC